MPTAHAEWWFRRSRLRLWLQLVVGGAAVVATLQVSSQQYWHYVLLLLCWAALLRDVLIGRRRIDGLSLQAGHWYLLRSGERLPVRLLRYHPFGIRWVVLTFRVGGAEVLRVSVLPDMLARADFRRLRLVLQAGQNGIGV